MANKLLKLPNGKFLKLGGSTGETWILNSTLNVPLFLDPSLNVPFTFNYITTDGATTYSTTEGNRIYYATINNEIGFESNNSLYTNLYNFNSNLYCTYNDLAFGPRRKQTSDPATILAMRTITFDIPPTGELLTWLQANAVKQEAISDRFLYKIAAKAEDF